MNVFKPTSGEYGAEMSSIDEVELAVVAMFLEIIGELVVVDTPLSMDPVKESLHLIIDSRSDIEPAPIIECVDIKVPTLMIQEFGEFWIYLATPSDQANRRCRQVRPSTMCLVLLTCWQHQRPAPLRVHCWSLIAER